MNDNHDKYSYVELASKVVRLESNIMKSLLALWSSYSDAVNYNPYVLDDEDRVFFDLLRGNKKISSIFCKVIESENKSRKDKIKQ